ncbi:carbonyl reductase family member 4 [Brachyhypopomus gauderio]|uniref:carbonyl reductase family member 4 n=1 Tax=Brachyhypopomus gauderio TaxID=698409 RepID=UPI004042611F
MSRLGVVFGGSRGIGQAVAQLMARKGHRVVVVSRNHEAALATAQSLPGVGHLGLSCDVSREQDVQRVFETLVRTHGPVDYLVNAAGINRDALLLRSRSEDMISTLHTNLLGSMFTCKAALRSMLSKGGAIVNIGSVVGVKGNAGQCVYSSSKAGLEGFTRSLAKEVASRSVRVSLVAPGLIRTDMTADLREEEASQRIPLRRFGQPEEVAQTVLFLLESPYVTGQVVLVDGGLHLAL